MPSSKRFALATVGIITLVACARDAVGTTAIPDGTRASASGIAAVGADLQVSGSASTGSTTEGAGLTYTFQVKNSGPDSATGTSFSDVLPAGMVYQGAELDGVSIDCPEVDATVSCDLGTIRSGGQSKLLLLVNAPMAIGSFTNVVSVVSAGLDPQPSNNTASVTIQVAAPATGGGGGGGGGGKIVRVAVSAFSSLPADFSGGGYIIAGGSQGLGFPFVAGTTGTFTSLTVAMHGSGTPGKAGFWLYADDVNNPGNPGALITNFFGPIPALGGSYTVIQLPKLAAPLLVAGQRYWLFCLGSAGELSAQWDLTSNVTLVSPVASGTPGLPLFVGPGLGRMPAFQIVALQ